MTEFSEFRRNETSKMYRSYGTQILFLRFYNGLKPVATKWVEPMALENMYE